MNYTDDTLKQAPIPFTVTRYRCPVCGFDYGTHAEAQSCINSHKPSEPYVGGKSKYKLRFKEGETDA